MAAAQLPTVTAAALFIVAERDAMVLRFNHAAREAMSAECSIEVIRHATHLFEEPGALEQVAVLARDWFIRHLVARSAL